MNAPTLGLVLLVLGQAPEPSASAPPVDAAAPARDDGVAAPADATPPASDESPVVDGAPEAAPPSTDAASDAPSADEAPAEAPLETAPVDDEAYAALDRCVEFMEAGDPTGARLCLDDVDARFPALSRDVARVRRLVDAQPAAPVVTAPEEATAELELMMPRFLKPGRLELAAVTGLYGVWAGVTGGILVGTNSDQYLWNIDPSLIILAGGSAGVGLGIAGLAGGYMLADVMDIDQGNAWAYTAGMTWGTSYAISFLPAMYDVQRPPWWLEDEIDFGLPLLGGALGAATGFGLSLAVDPEIAEVSMMNTGGWTAGLTGLLVGLNVIAWSVESRDLRPGLTVAASYAIGKTVGIVLGLGASEVLNYTWGETILGDVGVILGGLMFGSAAFAFVASPLAEPTMVALFGGKDDELFGKVAITFTSTAAVTGGMLGLVTTTAGLYLFHRFGGVPFIREDLPFQVQPMQMGLLLDRDGQPAPNVTFVSLVF